MSVQEGDMERWLAAWGLTPDGYPFSTPYTRSVLAPVRRGGEPAMLKLAGHPEEARGAAMMAWWAGDGAAPVLEREGPALLLARADDPEALPRMAFEGEDDRATTILCEVAARLHRPRPGPAPAEAVALSTWLRALQAAAGLGGPYARAAGLAQDMLAAPQELAILHGDITHANVLHFGPRGWLAIDPKGLVGERGYDYANIFRSPTVHAVTPERLARQLNLVARLAGLDRTRLTQWVVVHSVIALVWARNDGHALGRRALRFPEMALAELDGGS
jgi:streptomycin 6-kinase